MSQKSREVSNEAATALRHGSSGGPAVGSAARRLRDRRERDERLAGIIARLNSAGFEAREVFGAVTLTDEAAEDLLARLVAST